MSKEVILYVDDENLNLETFNAVFGRKYNVLTAKSADEAFEILENNSEIKIIISDQLMPMMTGLEFFNIVVKKYPHLVCIILTAYADIDIALTAINQGGIYRYILKPWKKEEMLMAIENALETFNLRKANRILIDSLQKKNEILRESEEKYKKLIENTIVGYLIIKNEKIVFANNAFTDIAGFEDVNEIIDRNIFEIFNLRQRIDFIDVNSKNIDIEIINQRNQKKNLLVNSIEIEINKERHIQSSFIDITKLRETEEELIIAKEKLEKADKLKSAFLTNISHEIRTPLNGIVGFSSLICELDTTAEEKKEYFQIIKYNSDYLVNMINDVVEISKAKTNNIEIIDSNISLFEVLLLTKKSFKNEIENKKLEFEIIHNQEIDRIITDNIIFKKIVYHLFSNAVKFTEKGKVSVRYYLSEDKKMLVFSIKDTGIGIEEKNYDTIFQTFRQIDYSTKKKYQGSGLGLSLVKSYIEKLNGKIWVNSKLGEGSEFLFTIPYRIYNIENQTNIVPKNEIKKVLIADDEEVNLFFLEKSLKKINIESIKAINGLEAIEIFEKNKDIDLVLMDIKMPHLDGIGALNRIRKMKKDVYVIALTAYTEEKNRTSIIEAGFDYFLEKPVNRKELTNLIKGL